MNRVPLRLLAAAALAASLPVASAAPERPRAFSAQRRPVSFVDRLLPAPVDGGFRQGGYWVWCGTAVKGDDGLYHHYASRWPRGLPFSPHWLTNSEVVHSVSATPEGPYRFADVALPPRGAEYWDGQMTHNPVVRRAGGKYVLFYTGATYRGERPSPGNPTAETSPLKLEAHRGERIGVATADSPGGPWRRLDRPVLDVRPGTWERYLVSNASPLAMPDGSFLLYYKGVEELRKHAIGVARAASVEGPYERLTDRPFDVGLGAEDPTMWVENGRYHALMLDHDRVFSDKEIYHATSADGLRWEAEPNPVAIPKDYPWADGVARRMSSTERPQVLVENGVATHVFIATGTTVNGQRETWSQVIPLRPESEVPDRAAWWREARFGMRVRWEPNRASPHAPAAWDARAVVAAARRAGMKYVVFPANHPDGFAMVRSKASSDDVDDATPWKRDPLAELAAAAREAGLPLGISFCLRRDDERMTPQLTEVLTGYGDLAVVWFDTPGQTSRKQSIALERLVRRLQPKAIVNSRVGNRLGDYEEMADNEVPERASGRDFEVPATLAESPSNPEVDPAPGWKPATRLIRRLVDVASKGGNFLLDVRLSASGAIPPEARERLEAFEQWTAAYGESVYGTSASSLAQPDWGRFTQRGDTLYAHVFEWPGRTLVLPVDASFLARVELLTPGKPVDVSWTPSYGASVVLKLPVSPPDPHVSVLRVKLRPEAERAKVPAPAVERGELRDWPPGTSPAEVGRRVALNFASRPFERPTRFVIYPEVCAWYGALTLARLTGDAELAKRLVRKLDPLLTPEGERNVSQEAHVDYRVFGAVPLEIALQTKDPKLLELGRGFADRQWEATTPDGITTEARYWIDDMYMITLLQVQAFRATGDERYLDRAALAMVAYLEKLQQPNGLFFHAPDSPFFWSRGNGWMAAGMAELLRALPAEHPRRARVLAGYRQMMAALLAYQGEDGLWRQLLDDPHAWSETSGTGMFTFAMVTGVKNGWLDGKTYGQAARRAWLGLVRHVDASGDVDEVCAGTNKGSSARHYLERPRKVGDLHGQAPLLWSAAALLR